MRKSKFTESQIMAILKQNEAGVPVPELCREHGIKRSRLWHKMRKKPVVLQYLSALCCSVVKLKYNS
ncbi:MAG: transposase [Gammaproteobacteria bacterium]|nr:transposase [Gammaproteobacteria bacterium]